MSTNLARQAVGFIWKGQTGLAELCSDFHTRDHYPVPAALDNLAAYRYFAPLTRAYAGMGKKAVSAAGNVLWADIDSRNAPELIEQGLAACGLTPSLIIDSANKGFWLYLKLDRLIPSERIEVMNRGLALLVQADDSWNIDRIARMPGSVNEKSGRTATVYELTGSVYDPAHLTFLEELAGVRTQTPTVLDDMPTLDVWFPDPDLPMPMWMYIRDKPQKDMGVDRSSEEQRIFTALVGQGWTDEQIISFADMNRLPRHREDLHKHKDYRWTTRSITNARSFIERTDKYSKLPYRSIEDHMCCESDTYSWKNRRQAFSLIQDGMTTSQFVSVVRGKMGAARRTAYRILNQLERGGQIRREEVGKHTFIYTTESGRFATSGRFRRMFTYPTIATLNSENKRYRGA